MGFGEELLEVFENLQKSKGLDNLTSRIIARLFIEPKEVAMEDLAKETGYSLASISNKIKMLEQAGFIQRKSKPKTKKVYLYMEKDFPKIIKDIFIRMQQVQIGTLKLQVPKLITNYKGKLKTEKEKQQMKILEIYYKDLLKIDKVMEEFIQKLKDVQ